MYYAYLNTEEAPVAWAVARGILVSSEAMPHEGFISLMMAGMIRYQANRRLYNEAIIEGVRRTRYSETTVSRLTGLYLFPDQATALKVAEDQHWPPYFEVSRLFPIEVTGRQKICRVDADWITFAPLSGEGLLDLTQLEWIDRYWSGDARSDNPTWEVLLAGSAAIGDKDKRDAVFQEVCAAKPESELYLLMSRIAGESGLSGGLAMPIILAQEDGTLRLVFIVDDNPFHDSAAIEKMAAHPDAPYMASLFRDHNRKWRLPDFTDFSAVFSVGSLTVRELGKIAVPTLHHV